MELLAKKIEKDGKVIATQTLQLHTAWVIEEALKFVDDNSLAKVSKIGGW